MLLLNCFLDTYEYANSDVLALSKSKINPIRSQPRGLRVSLVRLATAIAKTQHCQPLKRFVLPFVVLEQISALQRHMVSHGTGAERNLRLNERFFGKYGLRDFSKTSTIGEYAQGLSFLFAQDCLKVPALVDFDHFCDTTGVPRITSNLSKPDFVGCQNSRGYWLIEAKGNLESTSIKTELRKGVGQCELGAAHLIKSGLTTPQKSFTTLVSFRDQKSSNQTRLCYVDPEFPDDGRRFNTAQFLRNYYEDVIRALGFLGYIGDVWDNPDAAFSHNVFEESGVAYYRIFTNDSDRAVIPPPRRTPCFNPRGYYISGVSRDVINALAKRDVEAFFALIPSFNSQVESLNLKMQATDATVDLWEAPETFIDGTFVHYEMSIPHLMDYLGL
ncbi:hypothetical protein F6R97_26740 [Pseudomonas sp. JV414]|uniref:hypothetical protein n=1 Tax=Pseudomonas sp. JV414 TaxID=1733110 RepID=UPI0028E12D13|nr:hypothetical protein [Pseudomonas sp. JV414]MDT9678123.1 hypothetical protein [Pseudomonas sp. JV414]